MIISRRFNQEIINILFNNQTTGFHIILSHEFHEIHTLFQVSSGVVSPVVNYIHKLSARVVDINGVILILRIHYVKTHMISGWVWIYAEI